MKQIELDASGWCRQEHFYRALLPALGAPEWHGHNRDALDDSIFGGCINQVKPPFQVRITGTDRLSDRMKGFLSKVERLFGEGRSETGLDVRIAFDPPL